MNWLRKPWNIYEVDIKQSIQPLKTTDTICADKQLGYEYRYASVTFHFLTFFGHTNTQT